MSLTTWPARGHDNDEQREKSDQSSTGKADCAEHGPHDDFAHPDLRWAWNVADPAHRRTGNEG